MMARKLLAFAILFWAVPALLQASTPRDPYQFFFEQSLGDLSEELEIAREEGKQGVFLFFEMDECPFCHRMKQTVLNQPEVQEYFKQHFHSLSIDVEGDIDIVDFEGSDTTQKEFARQNRVRATPLLAFRRAWRSSSGWANTSSTRFTCKKTTRGAKSALRATKK
jgi:thioredoxin-related protein